MANSDGVINATTRGMTGHEAGSSVPAELLRPEMWVADCVYLPVMTELLQTAEKRGCRILPGTGMAVEQADKYLKSGSTGLDEKQLVDCVIITKDNVAKLKAFVYKE